MDRKQPNYRSVRQTQGAHTNGSGAAAASGGQESHAADTSDRRSHTQMAKLRQENQMLRSQLEQEKQMQNRSAERVAGE